MRPTTKLAKKTGIPLIVLGALLLAGPASSGLGTGDPLDPIASTPGGLLPDVQPQTPFLTGQTVWEATYDGSNGDDRAQSLAVHPTGLFTYVTGTSSGTSQDYATVAYEALTGAQAWEAQYDGPAGGRDLAGDIDVSPDGTLVFVTGSSEDSSGTGIATIAYDAVTGLESWNARYDAVGTGTQGQAALSVSPDGSRVYVTGGTGSWSGTYFTTVAYDAETGEELWVSHQAGGTDDQVQDIVVSPDGSGLFLTGWTQNTLTDYDYLTIALDAETGDALWTAQYDGNNNYDFPRTIGISEDGAHVTVTGGSWGSSFDVATIAYDAEDGTATWVQRYDGPARSSDNGGDLAVGGDRVFVTGSSRGSGTALDHVTLAYDVSTGDLDWEARYDGSGTSNDLGQAVAVSPGGTYVFSTGYSIGNGFDYATIAYDAEDGTALWDADHSGDGSGHDYPRDVAVDPLELRVYVTGQARAQNGDDTYGTVAYWI